MPDRVPPAFGPDEGELVLERQVLALARQIAELINAERPEEREILREIAVTAVRDQVLVAAPPAAAAMAAGAPRSFNPFAMAIPLGLMGGLLVFLFPPVGIALLLGAGVMFLWGVLVTLLVRS
ncbi:MAG TPA: hypothetical protein VEB21_18290 [Terriglobales bacterium]|nr:hypothetical protein [Terriglobales bacterium]